MYLDGLGSFLFEHKKAAYPAIPFRLGSYKFTNIKRDAEFVQELEQFHFGEMSFHRNDSQKKVAEHCKEVFTLNIQTSRIKMKKYSGMQGI